jgi:hypothetical protein
MARDATARKCARLCQPGADWSTSRRYASWTRAVVFKVSSPCQPRLRCSASWWSSSYTRGNRALKACRSPALRSRRRRLTVCWWELLIGAKRPTGGDARAGSSGANRGLQGPAQRSAVTGGLSTFWPAEHVMRRTAETSLPSPVPDLSPGRSASARFGRVLQCLRWDRRTLRARKDQGYPGRAALIGVGEPTSARFVVFRTASPKNAPVLCRPTPRELTDAAVPHWKPCSRAIRQCNEGRTGLHALPKVPQAYGDPPEGDPT